MVARYITAIVLIGIAGIYASQLRHGAATVGTLPVLDHVPTGVGGWRSESLPTDSTTAAVLDADVILSRVYTRTDGTAVGLFVAYFAQQQVNSQMHSPRNCLPGSGWNVRRISTETIPLPQGPQTVTRMLVARSRSEQEVLYWFRTRGGDLAGEYAVKWDLVKNSLARRPTDAAIIRFDGALADSTAMRELMALLDPEVRAALGEAGL
jgi:EpsI family protein